MQAKHARVRQEMSAIPQQGIDEDDDPETVRREIFAALHRVVSNKRRRWRLCDQRVCKRAKKCVASQPVCTLEDRVRPVKPRQEARAQAMLYRLFKEESDRREAEEEAAEKAAKAAKTHQKS